MNKVRRGVITIYPQLLGLLRDAQQRLGSIQAIADLIGYKRSSISLAINGKYTDNIRKIRTAIIDKLAEMVGCPHLGEEITAAMCSRHRDRSVPASNPSQVKHWQACQMCAFNSNSMTRDAL